MVYYADGNGRDSFIHRQPDLIGGNHKKGSGVFDREEQHISFWKKKNDYSQMVEAGIVSPRKPEPFPSLKSLRMEDLAESSLDGTHDLSVTSLPRETVFPTCAMNASEREFRAKTLPTVPTRIPGYQGHMPMCHEVIGAPVTSDRYMSETSEKPLEMDSKGNCVSTKTLDEMHMRKHMETLRSQSKRETLEQTSDAFTSPTDDDFADTLANHTFRKTTQQPVKYIRRPRVDLPTNHHPVGFAGHQPRSLVTLQCYEKNAKSTLSQ